MARQITLDGIEACGVNIFKEAGDLRVEASYDIMSGSEVIRSASRDITPHLSAGQLTALSDAYDAVFARIEQVELS